MDKIRNIKNRLSLSVDKLSPTHRSRSPPEEHRSFYLSTAAPLSEGSIPASCEAAPRRPRRRDRSRASNVSRRSSFVEVSSTEELEGRRNGACSTEDSSTVSCSSNLGESGQLDVNDQSFDNFQGFSGILSNGDPHSLVEEVMKEIEKISSITKINSPKSEANKNSEKSLNGPNFWCEPILALDDTQPCSAFKRKSKYDSFGDAENMETIDSGLDASSSSSLANQEKSPSSARIKGNIADGTPSAALHADSVTSGYFSDSASEDVESSSTKTKEQARQARAKTTSPIQRIFRSSKAKSENYSNAQAASLSLPPREPSPKKELPPKKESIYSRLIKSTKKDSSCKSKEPIYAKIRPKLKLENNFKPIEPSTTVDESSGSNKMLIKPEPIYRKLIPKDKSSPAAAPVILPPAVSISSGSQLGSSFTPVVASDASERKEPIYSSIKPKKERSRTLPLESLYSKIRKRDSSTMPREPVSPSDPPKSKEPIYNQPLPALPNESPYYSRTTTANDGHYGKVTVKTVEIYPSKPSVITIHNPGYANINSSSPPTTTTASLHSQPVSTSPQHSLITNSSAAHSSSFSPLSPPTSLSLPAPPVSFSSSSFVPISPPSSFSSSPPPSFFSPISSSRIQNDSSELTTPEPPQKERKIIEVESSEGLSMSCSSLEIFRDIDADLGTSSKLSRLVEELAQEIESVSQRSVASGEYVSKKEVLARFLSNYDVPKNLRPVEEACEDDLRLSERALLPLSISGDELRYMDDDENMETIYADVPNYSQDEFVIALDDENDPKYASLTRGMRAKHRGGESPGRVSHRSAQVYVNVLNVLTALKVLVNSNSTKAATVINRMGTLARPYAHKVQTSISDNTWIQRRIQRKSGHNGFDELRKYIKSGGEFCKEVSIILHERAELESTYAKGLHKLSTKLVKASREALGTISEGWQAVGEELEREGDIHRILATSLSDEVVRPLRQLIETQHKIRKGVEGMVDKTSKNLHDWRAAESKAKKNSYHNCRENEKVQDMVIESRLGRGKSLSEKETIKLEKQRRKAEDSVQKSDLEYYTYCIRTERARQEWELAVYKGSGCFQTLEEERLTALKELIEKYHAHNKEVAPKLVASAGRLDEPVANCDVEKDIQTIIAAKGTGENVPEQTLPDFYSEDLNNVMNKARRREALERFLNLIRNDLDRERRGKQGVENLAKALQETPKFGGEDSQQDVSDKLQNMKAMLAYLEATRWKVQSALDEINSRPKSSHPLAKHMEIHRDKSGVPISILKVPPWVRNNSTDVSPISESPGSSPNWNDRGAGDGNSVQPDSDFGKTTTLDNRANNIVATAVSPCTDAELNPALVSSKPDVVVPNLPPARAFMGPFRYPSLPYPADEFSSQGSDHEYQSAVTDTNTMRSQNAVSAKINIASSEEDQLDSGTGSCPADGTYYARPMTTVNPIGRCKALYDYEANMYDELSIRTGDIINIHEKQPDGWWVGELEGTVGIFPATYVEGID